MTITLDDIPSDGVLPVRCSNCGWDNDGELVLVDRATTDSPPGPLHKGDMLEVYREKYMDPDDKLSFCPRCDEMFLGDELDTLTARTDGSG